MTVIDVTIVISFYHSRNIVILKTDWYYDKHTHAHTITTITTAILSPVTITTVIIFLTQVSTSFSSLFPVTLTYTLQVCTSYSRVYTIPYKSLTLYRSHSSIAYTVHLIASVIYQKHCVIWI